MMKEIQSDFCLKHSEHNMNTIKFRNSNNYSNYNFPKKINRNPRYFIVIIEDSAIQRADQAQKNIQILWKSYDL